MSICITLCSSLLLEHLLPISGCINSWLDYIMQYTLNANCGYSQTSTLHRHGSIYLRKKMRRPPSGHNPPLFQKCSLKAPCESRCLHIISSRSFGEYSRLSMQPLLHHGSTRLRVQNYAQLVQFAGRVWTTTIKEDNISR